MEKLERREREMERKENRGGEPGADAEEAIRSWRKLAKETGKGEGEQCEGWRRQGKRVRNKRRAARNY